MSRRHVSNLLLAGLPYLALLGCAVLFVTIMVAFEEPDSRMLLVSGALLIGAPVGMAVHLAASKELTPEEKRKWVSALMSRRGLVLFGAYFDPATRRRATERLSSKPSAGQSAKA